MTARPMIFTTESVKAILEGRKTQTRRVIKKQPTFPNQHYWNFERCISFGNYTWAEWETYPVYVPLKWSTKCPYGQPGDRLWIREAWNLVTERGEGDETWLTHWIGEIPKVRPIEYFAIYRADDNDGGPWKSPLFMPRSLSRLNLEIVNIRVERLQAISEADAKAEGVNSVAEYKMLWDKINGKKHPWISKPWVWVVEFKKVTE